MAREHREKHKAHLDAHIRDANGDYHYIGVWYAVQGGKMALAPFSVWAVLAAAAVIAAGCVNFPGMRNTAYVILPYLLLVCVLFALCWNSVKLVSGGGRLKEFVWDKVHGSIAQICAILAILSGLTAVLAGLFLARSGSGSIGTAAAFIALLIAAGVFALLARRAFLQQVWDKE